MRLLINWIIFLGGSVLLLSCSNNSNILSGERQSILPNFADISINPDAANEIDLSLNKTLKTDASHAGGNERHSGGNLSLSFPLTLSWSARIKGIKDETIDLPQPIISAGRVFALDGNSELHAFDLETGKLLWSYLLDPKADEHIPGIIGGIAYRDNMVVAHSGRNYLYALDANTGDLIWRKV